jgi:hypothetical protein
MGLVTGLVAAIIVLVLLLAYLADCVIRLQAGVTNTDKADHAKCIAHIADVTSNRMVAVALRDLAERYDSVQGQRELHRARARWLDSTGPTVPAMWLLDRADELDPS